MTLFFLVVVVCCILKSQLIVHLFCLPIALAPVSKTPNLRQASPRFSHRQPGTPTVTPRVSAKDSPPLTSSSATGEVRQTLQNIVLPIYPCDKLSLIDHLWVCCHLCRPAYCTHTPTKCTDGSAFAHHFFQHGIDSGKLSNLIPSSAHYRI